MILTNAQQSVSKRLTFVPSNIKIPPPILASWTSQIQMHARTNTEPKCKSYVKRIASRLSNNIVVQTQK